MSLGLMRKTARDVSVLLISVTLGILLLEMLFVGVLREFSKELSFIWMQKPFLQRFVKMLVGAELEAEVSLMGMITIGFAHPLLFAMTWAFLLSTCSRVIVGEVERGTADLLLTLPVSRARIYLSVSAVWVLAGVVINLAALLGSKIGTWVFSLPEPLDFSRLAMLVFNLFALYLAVGSATCFASSLSSRRAPAVATVLGVLLASFLLNFLAQVWSFFERLSFLGILHYYRPLPVVRSGDWPLGDLTVLLGLAVILWFGGLLRFTRRDIPAA